MTKLVVSDHAVERYHERVMKSGSAQEARLALMRFVGLGRVRSIPRRWMRRDVLASPGLRFVYCAGAPGVCALVRGHVVTTIWTKEMCQAEHARPLRSTRPPPKRGAVEAARWRWDGNIEDEDEAA
jgi:hypothetical protein